MQLHLLMENSTLIITHYCDFVDCTDGDIRLAGVISNPLKGRVEICYDGVWGTVCNNPWNSLNAMVVCRQLGHATLGMP